MLATPEIEYITCNDFEFGNIGDIPFKLQTPYTIAEDKIFLLSWAEAEKYLDQVMLISNDISLLSSS